MGRVGHRTAAAAGGALAVLLTAGPAWAGPASAAGLLAAGGPGCFRAVATVKVGTAPEAVPTDPSTNLVYVANFGGKARKFRGSVSVISGRTNKVITTILVGRGADGIAVNSATDRIYVTSDFDGTVSVINGRTRRVVATVRVGLNPQDVAVNAAAGAAYVTNAVNGTVSVIRHRGGNRYRVATTVGSGGGPGAIAVDHTTNRVYVTSPNGDSLWVIRGPRGRWSLPPLATRGG